MLKPNRGLWNTRDMRNGSKQRAEKAGFEFEILIEGKDGLALRCKQSAKSRFDLEKVAGVKYRRIYKRLLSEK